MLSIMSWSTGPWLTFEIQLPQDDFNLLAWVLGEKISAQDLPKSKNDYQLRGLSSEQHLLEGTLSICYCTAAAGVAVSIYAVSRWMFSFVQKH